MIFIANKYTNTYYKIIQRASTREISGYTEKHHIIPKSLGGSNSKDNLIELTAREHFICHLLLTKMVTSVYKQKMTFALWILCNNQNKHQDRYKITGTTYQSIRENFSKEMSILNKGVKKTYSSFLGKKHTDETKKLQSAVKQGHLNPFYGKKHTAESKSKMGITLKGIPKPKYTCNVCGKTVGGLNNFLRWHKNRCE